MPCPLSWFLVRSPLLWSPSPLCNLLPKTAFYCVVNNLGHNALQCLKDAPIERHFFLSTPVSLEEKSFCGRQSPRFWFDECKAAERFLHFQCGAASTLWLSVCISPQKLSRLFWRNTMVFLAKECLRLLQPFDPHKVLRPRNPVWVLEPQNPDGYEFVKNCGLSRIWCLWPLESAL